MTHDASRRRPHAPGSTRHCLLPTAYCLLILLAACQPGGPPPLPLGVTPTPTISLGRPGAAEATSVAALATAQAQARRGGPRRRLWLMTGPTGSAEELWGRGIAQSIADKFDGHEATVEVSAGAPYNLTYLAERKADLALVTVDAAAEALAGSGVTAALPVRSLGVLYPNYLHLVTLADGGIRDIADLRGRPVALGPPGSTTEFVARRALAAAGLDRPDAIAARSPAPAEAAAALREREIVAFFWLGPAPAEPVRALAERRDVQVRLVPLGAVADRLTARHGRAYRGGAIPADAYPGQAGATPTVVVDTILAAHAGLDERVAHGTVAAMFDNIRELPFFHPEARHLTLLTAVAPTPIPFHPGAARFYRERGVLPGP